MENNLDTLLKMGVLPSVTLTQAEEVLPLSGALVKAGVPCVELMYNAAAEEAVKLLAVQKPGFFAGMRVETQGEALAARAAGARFITGGAEYATLDVNLIPGGRVVLPADLLCRQDWAQVTHMVKDSLLKFLDFGLRHVGINSKDETESSATASAFERIFGLPKEDRGGAYFAGDIIEVMKKPFYGTHGHIAISTADAACAARYLEAHGVKFNWASAGYNPDGRLRVVYLQDEIGGFAVHILQK